MADRNTKGRAKHILLYLAHLQEHFNTPVYPSMATIGKEVGCTARNVRMLISELEEKGYIIVTRVRPERGRPYNRYLINIQKFNQNYGNEPKRITEKNDPNSRTRAIIGISQTQEKEREKQKGVFFLQSIGLGEHFMAACMGD